MPVLVDSNEIASDKVDVFAFGVTLVDFLYLMSKNKRGFQEQIVRDNAAVFKLEQSTDEHLQKREELYLRLFNQVRCGYFSPEVENLIVRSISTEKEKRPAIK